WPCPPVGLTATGNSSDRSHNANSVRNVSQGVPEWWDKRRLTVRHCTNAATFPLIQIYHQLMTCVALYIWNPQRPDPDAYGCCYHSRAAASAAVVADKTHSPAPLRALAA